MSARIRGALVACGVFALFAVLFEFLFSRDTLLFIAALVIGIAVVILTFRFDAWKSRAFGLVLAPMPPHEKKLHLMAGIGALVAAVLWFAVGTALVAAGSSMMFPYVELPVTGLAVFGGAALTLAYGIKS